jgi:hypothetical protein
MGLVLKEKIDFDAHDMASAVNHAKSLGFPEIYDFGDMNYLDSATGKGGSGFVNIMNRPGPEDRIAIVERKAGEKISYELYFCNVS